MTTDLSVRAVRPDDDAELIHAWVSAERAVYWGLRGYAVQEVAGVYDYIASQSHLRAVLAELDGTPIALFHTYDPFVDEIGSFYDRLPGDVGLHLFLADDPRRAGRTTRLLGAVVEALLATPDVRRVVLEPDVRNTASLRLLDRVGAQTGPTVDLRLPHLRKQAQFRFIGPETRHLRPGDEVVQQPPGVLLPASLSSR